VKLSLTVEGGMKRIPVVLAAALLLAACGGVGDEVVRPGGPGDPDSPVTSSPVPPPTGPLPSPSPRVVEPRPGLTDIRPQPWDSARPRGPDTLLVAFYSGVHQCYGVDRVEVDYAPRKVSVTLFVCRNRNAQICVEIAEYQALEVALDEPIAGRKIVDGALA
jgi:hypothetical protein